MKISEVIKKLQELQKEHGDVEVLYYTETDCHGYYTPVRNDIISYEKEVNRQNAILLWGKDYEQIILSNRLSDIISFKNSYISIQQQIDDNEGLIESYNEKVNYYNKLKEQWSDISKAYEQSQEDQYASMVLGAQWERDVLSGRIDVLNNFKNQYIAIQQAITNAALEAARAQA